MLLVLFLLIGCRHADNSYEYTLDKCMQKAETIEYTITETDEVRTVKKVPISCLLGSKSIG